MIYVPNMLMIGSTGRNSGKTEFACAVIRHFGRSRRIVAVKATTVHYRDGKCPRGGEGCGACTAIHGNFAITEESQPGTGKDTQRLLAAGACNTYWLRVLKDALEEGARALLERVDPGALLVCESNSLRKIVEPGLFLMVRQRDAAPPKHSAHDVMEYADAQVTFDGTQFDLPMERLEVSEGCWRLQRESSGLSIDDLAIPPILVAASVTANAASEGFGGTDHDAVF